MQLNGTISLNRWDMERIDNALVYIEKHYRNPISADHLALEVNLSKEKLQKGIQQITGLTLHLFILRLRTEKAKELLRNTDHPVKSIAAATGFKRASHFIDIFKKFQTLTPNQYRLQMVG